MGHYLPESSITTEEYTTLYRTCQYNVFKFSEIVRSIYFPVNFQRKTFSSMFFCKFFVKIGERIALFHTLTVYGLIYPGNINYSFIAVAE